MGCGKSKQASHVDLYDAVDQLPPYSEKPQGVGSANTSAPKSAQLAIAAAAKTPDVYAAAVVLAAAANLNVDDRTLRVQLLAALISTRTASRLGGCTLLVESIVNAPIATLESSIAPEDQPQFVAELARVTHAAGARSRRQVSET